MCSVYPISIDFNARKKFFLGTLYAGTAPSYFNPVCGRAVGMAHYHPSAVLNLILIVDVAHVDRVRLSACQLASEMYGVRLTCLAAERLRRLSRSDTH